MAALVLGSQGAWADGTTDTLSTAPRSATETGSGVAKVTTPVDTTQNPLQQDSGDLLADSYQPKGIEVGNFTLFPKLDLSGSYNSNIYATPHDVKSDFLTTLGAGLELRSRFTQHELNAELEAEQIWYTQYSANNVTNVRANANGTYDVDRNTKLTLALRGYSAHEERGSNDSAQGTEPTPTLGGSVDIGAETKAGAFTINGDALIARYTFDNVPTSNGGEVDNQSRDRTEYTGTLRGAYEIIPGYAAVLSTSVNRRDYDSNLTFGENRNSNGYSVAGGIGVDLTRLLRGDFLLGYFEQNYDAPGLKDPSGLTVKAVFNWTPSKITLVVPAIERSVVESTLSGVSGLVRTSYSVLVRHEYARNIILRGYVAYFQDQYPGLGDHTNTFMVNGQVTYAFMPELDLTAMVGYTNKDSTISSQTYDQTVTTLTLGVRF